MCSAKARRDRSDLFADSGGFFHTHLLARLSLSAHATRSKVAISARDAGDPVAGASDHGRRAGI